MKLELENGSMIESVDAEPSKKSTRGFNKAELATMSDLLEAFYPYLTGEQWVEFFEGSKNWNEELKKKKAMLNHEAFVEWLNNQCKGE